MSPKLTPVRPTQEDAANLMRAVRAAVRFGTRAGWPPTMKSRRCWTLKALLHRKRAVGLPRAWRLCWERARETRSESE